MERREFLKKLGIGVAASAVPISVVASMIPEEIQDDKILVYYSYVNLRLGGRSTWKRTFTKTKYFFSERDAAMYGMMKFHQQPTLADTLIKWAEHLKKSDVPLNEYVGREWVTIKELVEHNKQYEKKEDIHTDWIKNNIWNT